MATQKQVFDELNEIGKQILKLEYQLKKADEQFKILSPKAIEIMEKNGEKEKELIDIVLTVREGVGGLRTSAIFEEIRNTFKPEIVDKVNKIYDKYLAQRVPYKTLLKKPRTKFEQLNGVPTNEILTKGLEKELKELGQILDKMKEHFEFVAIMPNEYFTEEVELVAQLNEVPLSSQETKQIKRLNKLIKDFSNILKEYIPPLAEDIKSSFAEDSVQQSANELQGLAEQMTTIADNLAIQLERAI